MAIEFAINKGYEDDPLMKDKTVINALTFLSKNPDIKLPNKLVLAIQDNIKLILSVDHYSKSEVLGSIKKVLKSVKNHHKEDGVFKPNGEGGARINNFYLDILIINKGPDLYDIYLNGEKSGTDVSAEIPSIGFYLEMVNLMGGYENCPLYLKYYLYYLRYTKE